MLSPETIAELAAEATERAAAQNLVPYVPYNAEEINSWPPFPFPNLGSYQPDGWELEDYWTCDKTGIGREYEPALTWERINQKVLEYIGQPYGFAVIEEGEFQFVLGAFKRLDSYQFEGTYVQQ